MRDTERERERERKGGQKQTETKMGQRPKHSNEIELYRNNGKDLWDNETDRETVND